MNAPIIRARPSGRRCVGTLVILLAAVAPISPARGAEMVVQGRVVDVVPLTAEGNARGGDCHPPRPAAGAGLIELLEWDLRAGCGDAGRGAVVTGYRVYYEWDGRTYSQVMPEPPGDTVSLRVRIR